jgi:hypothetical protein
MRTFFAIGTVSGRDMHWFGPGLGIEVKETPTLDLIEKYTDLVEDAKDWRDICWKGILLAEKKGENADAFERCYAEWNAKYLQYASALEELLKSVGFPVYTPYAEPPPEPPSPESSLISTPTPRASVPAAMRPTGVSRRSTSTPGRFQALDVFGMAFQTPTAVAANTQVAPSMTSAFAMTGIRYPVRRIW